MNLTDLIRGEDFHRLAHIHEDEAATKVRMDRIRQAYAPAILECLAEHGSVLGCAKTEYAFYLSILATVDLALELSMSGKKN